MWCPNLEYSMDCVPWMPLIQHFLGMNSCMHRLSFSGEMWLWFPSNGAFLHCKLFYVAIAFPRLILRLESFCWKFVESFSMCLFRFVSTEQTVCWMSFAWGVRVGTSIFQSKAIGIILRTTHGAVQNKVCLIILKKHPLTSTKLCMIV